MDTSYASFIPYLVIRSSFNARQQYPFNIRDTLMMITFGCHARDQILDGLQLRQVIYIY